MELIIFIVVITAAFFLFIISMGIRAQRKKVRTGLEGLIGEIGTAVTKLSPRGKISVHGEYWNAESIEGEVHKGEDVVVDSIFNLLLKVKKAEKS